MPNNYLNFGVDLLPKTDNTYNLGNINYKWNIFISTINGSSISDFLSSNHTHNYLPLTGGTLSDNLTIQKDTTPTVAVTDPGTSVEARLYVDDTHQNHGLYSTGYYDTAFNTNGKWMIYRNGDGNVIVNGNAINVTGVVAIANGGTGATTAPLARTALGLGTAATIAAPISIANGGTGKTTDLEAVTSLGSVYIKPTGTEITASSNLDSGYKTIGSYYSGSSTRSQTLSGTVPVTGSGFKIITYGGYRTATLRQFLAGADYNLYYRSSQDTGGTWTKWYKFVLLPSGSDSKTFSAIGGSTTPVYVDANGVITAGTALKSAAYDDVVTVAHGGTGKTTLALARNAMGLGNTTGALPIANGGTGSTTAALARTALGLGSASVDDVVTIAHGGTGKTTAADARTALGLGAAATIGTPVSIANGGTGKTSAALARTALGLGDAAVDDVVTVAHGGTGKTTLALARNAMGLGNTTGALPIANGGTGKTSAADARTALGLGAAATIGTPVSIANGGTGKTSASLARTALGLGGAATNAVANNLTTTDSGSVLDARQGKALNDTITSIGTTSVSGKGITFSARKVAKLIIVTFDGSLSAGVSSGDTIATLPSGYRPAAAFYFPTCNRKADCCDTMSVHTDGTIKARNGISSGTVECGQFSFIIS